MIIYSPERGGLGDGIVGCSSAFVLSICLEEEFKILNGSIKFNNYFDIPEKYKLSKIKYLKNLITNLQKNMIIYLKIII